jgi:threonine dehydrogenase-like Zn-dependent dehydrogenase
LAFGSSASDPALHHHKKRCVKANFRADESVAQLQILQSKRFDPVPLLTHSFKLDEIVEAYDVFASRRDGCFKVSIMP